MKIGFDDPSVSGELFEAFIEKEIKEVLREMGFQPSADDPNYWVRGDREE